MGAVVRFRVLRQSSTTFAIASETRSRVRSSTGYEAASDAAGTIVLLTVLALPCAYVAWLVALVIKRRGADVVLGLVVSAVTVAAGAWEIRQSRSSTAAIGFVFLPSLAAVAGSLALGYAASRRTASRELRMLGLAALVASAAPAVIALRGGKRTVVRNASRDADQARRDSAYARYRVQLDTLVAAAGARATDTLAALLRAHSDDRELVLAALERPQISPTLLDSFARSPDLGIALQAIRNPGASSETLERLYRTHQYRDYFLQALAAHANTPPTILREIRSIRPAPITGLDIWFAGNPSTPTDVLLDVARTSESIDAIRTLLARPALDCRTIESAARGPAVQRHPADADIRAEIATTRSAVCR